MLSWGSKKALIGEFINPTEDNCAVCNAKEKRCYFGEQSYFVLCGLPLFPTGKTYYRSCSQCNSRLKLRATDPMQETVSRAIPGGFSMRYWWGWAVVVVLLIAIALLVQTIQK